MGEAKRRKKILGKDYGKKPSVLIEGTPQYERHLLKFADAWTQKLEEMGEPEELSEPEREMQQKEFDQWLKEYLKDYGEREREKLVMGILDPLYAELAEIPQSGTEAIKFALSWSMESLFMHKMFKAYLSETTAREYAKPLVGFYEVVLREAIEKREKDELDEVMDKLKQEFEEILEIEVSKRF